MAGRRRSLSIAKSRRGIRVLYAGKSSWVIKERDQSHKAASGDTYFYRLIKEHDLEAITFTAWRAPLDAESVLFALIETIFMVAFGTLKDRDSALTALRTRLINGPGFGVFDIDQAYEPANDMVSLNDVAEKFDSPDEYMLRQRQRQFTMRGDHRTEEQEEHHLTKTAALQKLGRDAVCPLEKCNTILKV